MKPTIVIEMFSRPNCHLCDVTRVLIEKLRDRYPLTFRVVNVEDNAALEKEYGARLPVVRVLDGRHNGTETMLDYPIEEADLQAEVERLWTQSTS